MVPASPLNPRCFSKEGEPGFPVACLRGGDDGSPNLRTIARSVLCTDLIERSDHIVAVRVCMENATDTIRLKV